MKQSTANLVFALAALASIIWIYHASHTVQPEVATLDAADTMRGVDPSTLPHGPRTDVYDEYLSVWRAGYIAGRESCVLPVDPAHEWRNNADDALSPPSPR